MKVLKEANVTFEHQPFCHTLIYIKGKEISSHFDLKGWITKLIALAESDPKFAEELTENPW